MLFWYHSISLTAQNCDNKSTPNKSLGVVHSLLNMELSHRQIKIYLPTYITEMFITIQLLIKSDIFTLQAQVNVFKTRSANINGSRKREERRTLSKQYYFKIMSRSCANYNANLYSKVRTANSTYCWRYGERYVCCGCFWKNLSKQTFLFDFWRLKNFLFDYDNINIS